MFEEYKTAMSIRSRLISDDIDRFVRSYQRRDRALLLFMDLLSLLKQDYFLALDSTLFQKVYDITILLAFRFSDVPEILGLRKKIYRELVRQKQNFQNHSEKIIQDILFKEISERKIPTEFSIGKEEVLEMYKNDFKNYTAICFQDPPIGDTDLFYYLTTVNRIYADYPEQVKERRMIISFMIMKLQREVSDFLELEKYIQLTEGFIDPQKEKTLQKTIIEFPKGSNF